MTIHKAIRFLMQATILLVQIVFLTMIIQEKYETGNFVIIVLISLIIVTLFFGSKSLNLHDKKYSYESISVVIGVPIGAVICYLLNITLGLGSVLAAGITGILASFLPSINKASTYLNKLPSAIYCGAFIGMSSAEITPSINFIIIAGILAGLFLMLSKNLFLGIGGKLGTIAFAAMVIASLIHYLFI